jgi:hypothetical protein
MPWKVSVGHNAVAQPAKQGGHQNGSGACAPQSPVCYKESATRSRCCYMGQQGDNSR